MAFEYAGHVWRKSCDMETYKRFFRQPSAIITAARKQPQTRKAMLQKAKDQPTCEACGYKKIQVHHKLSVSNYPLQAWIYDNLCSLCWHCHRVTLGHPRGTRSYNPNIDQHVKQMREIVNQAHDQCIVTKSHKWFEKQQAEDVPNPPSA